MQNVSIEIMKIHRFIAKDFNLKIGEMLIEGQLAKQIKNVLHLEVGEKVELCDGNGSYSIGEIINFTKDGIEVRLGEIMKERAENKKVTLFCAVLKKENFEMVVQKTTEIGITKIIPVITARTIKTGLNMERLKKISLEASEQSGRKFLPEILEPINFIEALEISKKEENFLFDASGEDKMLLIDSSHRNIWIGPEGGWTEEEIKKTEQNNFKKISLGKNILRGETAAIVASFLGINS